MSIRYSGQAWEKRFFSRLTTDEIAAMDKENSLLVLMVGAIEQSGPHLPIYTDMLIGETYLERAFELLPEEESIWLLPPLPYGKSTEHINFPGTMTLSSTTLMHVIADIARSVKRSGFNKLLLFNPHGGNSDLLNMIARDIWVTEKLEVYRLDASTIGLGRYGVSEEEKAIGVHGGDVPTSFIQAVKPEWVRQDKVLAERPNFPSDGVFSFANRSFAWVMSDISNSGITGDATISSAEKGEAMIQHGCRLFAEAMVSMAHFDMKSLK